MVSLEEAQKYLLDKTKKIFEQSKKENSKYYQSNKERK